MQAIKAYYDEGKFVPFQPMKLQKGSLAIVTMIDSPVKENQLADSANYSPDESKIEWLNQLHKALDASMDEDLSDFPIRSNEMRPPVTFNSLGRNHDLRA